MNKENYVTTDGVELSLWLLTGADAETIGEEQSVIFEKVVAEDE